MVELARLIVSKRAALKQVSAGPSTDRRPRGRCAIAGTTAALRSMMTARIGEEDMPSILSAEQVRLFHEDGLVFVRGLFDPEETALLRRAMEEDPQVRGHI